MKPGNVLWKKVIFADVSAQGNFTFTAAGRVLYYSSKFSALRNLDILYHPAAVNVKFFDKYPVSTNLQEMQRLF